MEPAAFEWRRLPQAMEVVMELWGLQLQREMIDADSFFKYHFKVEHCTKEGCPGAAKCPAVHPGEQRRRDPRSYSYSCKPCLVFVCRGDCPDGEDCKEAHGLLESFLHPDQFSARKMDFSELEMPMELFDIQPYFDGARPAFEFLLNWKAKSNLLPLYPALRGGYPGQSGFYNNGPAIGLAAACSFGDDAANKPYGMLNLQAITINSKKLVVFNGFSQKFDPFSRSSGSYIADPYRGNYKDVDPSGGRYNVGWYNNSSGTVNKNLYTAKKLTLEGEHLASPFWSGGGSLGSLEDYKSTSGFPVTNGYYSPERIYATFAAAFMKERMKISPDGILPGFKHSFITAGRMSVCNLGGMAGSEVRLIADTGANIHAVGDYLLLQGVQLFPTPMCVTLPDNSQLPVVGVGRIEWENFSIPNVYLIEGFQKGLISISQLDSDHGMHSTFGQGKCEIMLADGTVVGAGFLQHDGMYALSFLEVPEPPAQE